MDDCMHLPGNDLIEYQFNNIVKLMSGLGKGESIQEKLLKDLSANLAALMVVENRGISDNDGIFPRFYSQADTLQNPNIIVKNTN